MDPTARLRWARELRIRCVSGSKFLLRVGAREVSGGEHTLALLDAFRSPRSMNEVLASFSSRLTGAHEWMALTQQILHLHAHGVLVDEAGAGTAAALWATAGFGAAGIHIRMLEDRERTHRYLEAIRAVIRPGDVVVDLGTGSGVLAIAAARAGARRVYAIESTEIAQAARRAFADNGVADRIELIEGHSTQVQLAERADVLVSEIIGNEPLSERILETTADAVRRFLKPEARLIPAALRVYAFPAALTAAHRDGLRVSDATLHGWQRDYGIDFSALADISRCSPGLLQLMPAEIADLPALAPAQCISDYDLTRPAHELKAATAVFECSAAGCFEALVLWFEADLAPGQRLSTDPSRPRPDNHWSHSVLVLAEALPLRAGDRVRVRIDIDNPAKVVAGIEAC